MEKIRFSTLLVLLLGAKVGAEDFSYTHFGIDVGKVTFDDPLYILDDEYDDGSFVSLNGAYEGANNLVVAISSSGFYGDQPITEYHYGYFDAYIKYPVSVSDRIDFIPFGGLRRDFLEVCAVNSCVRVTESGLGFGVEVRASLIQNQLEFFSSITEATQEGFDMEFEFGSKLYLDDHNTINIRYRTDDTVNTASIGYAYHW